MPNILIVDDVATICEYVSGALKDEGYQAQGVESAREALELMQASHFDLLITDLLMPDMDGFELITSARKIIPNIKVIVMTGGGAIPSETYLELASHRSLVDAALEKPLDMERLIAETRKALGN